MDGRSRMCQTSLRRVSVEWWYGNVIKEREVNLGSTGIRCESKGEVHCHGNVVRQYGKQFGNVCNNGVIKLMRMPRWTLHLILLKLHCKFLVDTRDPSLVKNLRVRFTAAEVKLTGWDLLSKAGHYFHQNIRSPRQPLWRSGVSRGRSSSSTRSPD